MARGVSEGVGRIGWNIDGLARFRHDVLVAKAELDLAFEDGEHLLEVVTMRRGAAAGRDVHVDEGVLAGGVVAGHQDRVGVADESEVGEGFVVVGSCDREVSVRIIGRYRKLRCGWVSHGLLLVGTGGSYVGFARSRGSERSRSAPERRADVAGVGVGLELVWHAGTGVELNIHPGAAQPLRVGEVLVTEYVELTDLDVASGHVGKVGGASWRGVSGHVGAAEGFAEERPSR